jgi:predicted nucleic acid-binding protein
MSAVFVDTSAFFALVDPTDTNHRRAKAHLKLVLRGRHTLLTTTDIFDEAVTLIRYRLGHGPALTFGTELRASAWCRLVDVTAETRELAWSLFARHADQPFSFTDCTSFATMRSMQLSEAFTFDRRDFGAAGFVAVPGPPRR